MPLGIKEVVILPPSASLSDHTTEELILVLRHRLSALSPEQRREQWTELWQGYCPHCSQPYLPCYCWNDE